MLVLKKKYRDSGSFRGAPAAAKYLPSDQDQLTVKRAKKDDPQLTQATDVPGELASDIEALDDDKENVEKSSSRNVPDMSADGVNIVDDKIDEELEMSADGQLTESDDVGESSDSGDIKHADVINDDISTSTEMLAMENIDYGLCIVALFYCFKVLVVTLCIYVMRDQRIHAIDRSCSARDRSVGCATIDCAALSDDAYAVVAPTDGAARLVDRAVPSVYYRSNQSLSFAKTMYVDIQ